VGMCVVNEWWIHAQVLLMQTSRSASTKTLKYSASTKTLKYSASTKTLKYSASTKTLKYSASSGSYIPDEACDPDTVRGVVGQYILMSEDVFPDCLQVILDSGSTDPLLLAIFFFRWKVCLCSGAIVVCE